MQLNGRHVRNAGLAELSCCALMGTVVRAGSGTGVVTATGAAAEFGRIALGLGERQPETEFQAGLRKFSMLLVQVAGVLTAAIFIAVAVEHRQRPQVPGTRAEPGVVGHRGGLQVGAPVVVHHPLGRPVVPLV